MKKNKLINSTTLMNFKSMPSERSQTQKSTHYMIPFMWYFGKGKIARMENPSGALRSWELGRAGQQRGMRELFGNVLSLG